LAKRYAYDKKVARFLRGNLKSQHLLNHIIHQMIRCPDLGQLFAQVFMDERPTRDLITPRVILKLLLG
jgi:hypothetical protein